MSAMKGMAVLSGRKPVRGGAKGGLVSKRAAAAATQVPPPRAGLVSKKAAEAAAAAVSCAEQQQASLQQGLAATRTSGPAAGSLSAEEQRRRKRAERFSASAAEDPAGTESVAVPAPVAHDNQHKAKALVITSALPVEAERRLNRSERFGSAEDGQKPAAESGQPAKRDATAAGAEDGNAKRRKPNLLSRALAPALTVSTNTREGSGGAQAPGLKSPAGRAPLTPLRRIQNEKVVLSSRHQKEILALKRRHAREMAALEKRGAADRSLPLPPLLSPSLSLPLPLYDPPSTQPPFSCAQSVSQSVS